MTAEGDALQQRRRRRSSEQHDSQDSQGQGHLHFKGLTETKITVPGASVSAAFNRLKQQQRAGKDGGPDACVRGGAASWPDQAHP